MTEFYNQFALAIDKASPLRRLYKSFFQQTNSRSVERMKCEGPFSNG